MRDDGTLARSTMKLSIRPAMGNFARRVARRWREVASTLVHDVVALGSLLVIFPLITRGLGPEHYGQYTILYLIFGLVSLWISAGPNAAVVQLVLQLEFDVDELLRVARRGVYLAGIAGGLAGTAVAVALLGPDLIVPAVLVLFVDLVITSLANINIGTVYAIEGVERSIYARISVPLIRTAGVVALSFVDGIAITTLVAVNVAASATMLAASAIIVHRRLPPAEPRRVPTAGDLRRYSTYYSVTMSTNSIQTEGEKFVLATARSTREVGQYAAAYRVVSTALVPLHALVAAGNRWFMIPDDRVGAQRERTLRLTIPVATYGLVAGVAIVLGRGLIEWFAGSEFDDAGLIAVWLCALPLLAGLAELPPMGLIGLGRNRERMFMGLGTSATAAGAYLVLVPWLGWRGAVLGTYISEIASIAVGWILLVRYQRRADATGAIA